MTLPAQQAQHAGGDGAGNGAGESAPRHLLGVRGLPRETLLPLLHAGGAALDTSTIPWRTRSSSALLGKRVATLFLEDSTRTRASFTLAARTQGADALDVSAAASSISKGESVTDTARVIASMGADALVVRSGSPGMPGVLARALAEVAPDCLVVNAGDGRHEHPTLALGDALVIANTLGREGFGFEGLRVLIVGDVLNSRVARSNAACLRALGAKVVAIGPTLLAPASLENALGVRVSRDLDAELEQADVVMLLRIQRERGGGRLMGSVRDYRLGYALTGARAERLKPGAIVMHPGPVNRGVEIDPGVADAPRSMILHQVSAGVAARAGVLRAMLADDARAGHG
ncbi:MAG: aspartate carbamoyltransferase catalytic subunit [Planctomycetota bacterium]